MMIYMSFIISYIELKLKEVDESFLEKRKLKCKGQEGHLSFTIAS